MQSTQHHFIDLYQPIPVTQTITLLPLHLDMADEIFSLIDASRDYLARWLPWVPFTKTSDDTREFITASRALAAIGKAYRYAIAIHVSLDEGDGGIQPTASSCIVGLTSIEFPTFEMDVTIISPQTSPSLPITSPEQPSLPLPPEQTAQPEAAQPSSPYHNTIGMIGYWLGQKHQGKGYMTIATQGLIHHWFTTPTLAPQAFKIQVEPDNDQSHAVTQRLGFRPLHEQTYVSFGDTKYLVDVFIRTRDDYLKSALPSDK